MKWNTESRVENEIIVIKKKQLFEGQGFQKSIIKFFKVTNNSKILSHDSLDRFNTQKIAY